MRSSILSGIWRSSPTCAIIHAAAIWASATSPTFAEDGFDLPVIPVERIALQFDSGLVASPLSGGADVPVVIFSTVVHRSGAAWLRVYFDVVQLSGDPAGNGAFLRLVSAADGAEQKLDSHGIAQWANSSAYFNGDTVLIDVLSYPGTGPSRVVMSGFDAGPRVESFQPRSICGPTDDRVLSNDPRVARYLPSGCTAWLFDDPNRTFLTAGHCGVSSTGVVQFNVPLSLSNGSLQHPPPSEQYSVDPASVQSLGGGIGNDYAYFGVFPNSTTGLPAVMAQGGRYFETALAAPTPAGQPMRITGCGTVSSPVSPTWNQVQKTHTGTYVELTGTRIRYTADTTGGNSGSAVEDRDTKLAIGIHTHAGCNSTGGSNQGTAIQNAGLRAVLASPRGVCRSGVGQPGGPLYASADINRTFGTLNQSSGLFAGVLRSAVPMQGLAYDRSLARFLGCSDAAGGGSLLHRIDPSNGNESAGVPITPAGLRINGLGYDPHGDVLYGISQASGQLYSIGKDSGIATPIGPPGGGNVGALDFGQGELYGLDDDAAGTRLVRFDTDNGSRTVIGPLGANATDCNGLAFDAQDGMLYTVNAPSGMLLRINPTTGAAVAVGQSFGMFGATLGMAATVPVPDCTADANGDGGVTIEDLLLFLQRFDDGSLDADIDLDGGVTIEDLLGFLLHFDMGC